MVRGLLLVTAALGGCADVWDLELIPAAEIDAADPACETDGFQAPLLDARWKVDTPDGRVTVGIEAGELVIRPPSLFDGYNAVSTASSRDLTNKIVTVQVVESLNTENGDTQFAVALDPRVPTNYFLMYTHTSYIGWRKSIDNINVEDGLTYTLDDRFWQIRFESAEVVFATSLDGEAFRERYRLPTGMPVTQMFVKLSAGTYSGGSSTPGQARFDNVKICTPQAP